MPAQLLLALRIALMAISLLSSTIIIILIMKQSSDSEGGLGAISGTKDTTSSFYGKNKAKRIEHRLKKWTIICSIVLAVCCIIFFILAL